MIRWRVQRALTLSRGYGRGWFAQSYDGLYGAWFATWDEAMSFASKQTRIALRTLL